MGRTTFSVYLFYVLKIHVARKLEIKVKDAEFKSATQVMSGTQGKHAEFYCKEEEVSISKL